MSYILACDGDLTDSKFGGGGAVHSITTTVTIGGRAVCTLDSPVDPHGNHTDRKRSGFNSVCGCAKVSSASGSITIQGKPAAMLNLSSCSCGIHKLTTPTGTTSVTGGG